MKRIYNTLTYLFIAAIAMSCVTGNDDNEVLRDLEAAIAKTPRVTDLLINGEKKTRDSVSVWHPFFVKAGDVVSVRATINTGEGASSSTYSIFRQYYGQVYGQEAPMPVEPLTEMDFDYGAGATEFTLDYTVPAQDDDGFDFEPHNIITITFSSVNDLGGAGFENFVLEYE